MPLTMASPGDGEFTIHKISGRDHTIRRLAEMGFVTGATITVISEVAGNLILGVKGTRVALDKTLAQRIMV